MPALNIIVIGGGPAGVFAAIEAKRRAPEAEVALLSDEPCEPYERPPLSKAVLLGKAAASDAPIAGPKLLAGHGVALFCNTRCTSIDRTGAAVVTSPPPVGEGSGVGGSGKRFPYDALVIATGSAMRQVLSLPLGAPRVHYLRTEAQARALATELRGAQRLVVVGGGLIGLEVAASAAELGIGVTVIEVLPRILARVCDEETSARVLDVHRRHGVDVRLGAALTGVQAQSDGRIALKTAAGDTFLADLVVVGAGTLADDRLAAEAGLATDNGIIVDSRCATADPKIFAAGDVVRFPAPTLPSPASGGGKGGGLMRREDWRHAQDQGAVAGRNAAAAALNTGQAEEYRALPSFWSEQFDLYIQGVGIPPARLDARVRRTGPGGEITFDLTGRHIAYALGINAQRELATVRRLIERQIAVDPTMLADPAKPLAELLKAKQPSA
jgi:3-phenylpropionate/trans-cinnamate dioxygenase ferredoxin reductase subunit